MKAVSNGVLNCTVLDGWTYEVDWTDTGWVLDPVNIADDFYNKLENEIVPLYYDRDKNGIPVNWIRRMRKSIELAKNFSMDRVFSEYKSKIYAID